MSDYKKCLMDIKIVLQGLLMSDRGGNTMDSMLLTQCQTIDDAIDELTKANELNERYKKALEFYANNLSKSKSMCNRIIIQDAGTIATTALNKSEVE
jgi:hypothetical protein